MGDNENYLAHYGVKGQKWGVRRYQNEDGTLTPEGRRKYNQLPIGARQDYRRYGSIIEGIRSTNEKLKKKYALNPGNQRLKRAIEQNEKDIQSLAKVRDETLSKEYTDKFDTGKAMGYGLLAGGSAGVAMAAARNMISGGSVLMNAPIAVAASSATIEFGREYLRQINLRKQERGGAT